MGRSVSLKILELHIAEDIDFILESATDSDLESWDLEDVSEKIDEIDSVMKEFRDVHAQLKNSLGAEYPILYPGYVDKTQKCEAFLRKCKSRCEILRSWVEKASLDDLKVCLKIELSVFRERLATEIGGLDFASADVSELEDGRSRCECLLDDFYQFLARANVAIRNDNDVELQTLFDDTLELLYGRISELSKKVIFVETALVATESCVKSPVKKEPLKPVFEDLFSIVQSRDVKEDNLRNANNLDIPIPGFSDDGIIAEPRLGPAAIPDDQGADMSLLSEQGGSKEGIDDSLQMQESRTGSKLVEIGSCSQVSASDLLPENRRTLKQTEQDDTFHFYRHALHWATCAKLQLKLWLRDQVVERNRFIYFSNEHILSKQITETTLHKTYIFKEMVRPRLSPIQWETLILQISSIFPTGMANQTVGVEILVLLTHNGLLSNSRATTNPFLLSNEQQQFAGSRWDGAVCQVAQRSWEREQKGLERRPTHCVAIDLWPIVSGGINDTFLYFRVFNFSLGVGVLRMARFHARILLPFLLFILFFYCLHFLPFSLQFFCSTFVRQSCCLSSCHS